MVFNLSNKRLTNTPGLLTTVLVHLNHRNYIDFGPTFLFSWYWWVAEWTCFHLFVLFCCCCFDEHGYILLVWVQSLKTRQKLSMSDSKYWSILIYKAILIKKIVWYWHKDRCIDQWHLVRDENIIPQTYEQLIFWYRNQKYTM